MTPGAFDRSILIASAPFRVHREALAEIDDRDHCKGPIGHGGPEREMRILIHEWVSGGGLAGEPVPPSLGAEGRAMRDAIAREFAAVPGIEVLATLDARFQEATRTWRTEPVDPGEEWATLARVSKRCDYTLLIAPETGGALSRLCRHVASLGGRTLNAEPGAIDLVTDKRSLCFHWQSLGIPTPCIVNPESSEAITSRELVAKPRDGAGCLDTFRISADRLRDFVDQEKWIVQPYIRGASFSASFLIGPGMCLHSLGVASQSILEQNGGFSYQGGRLPGPRRWTDGVVRDAVSAIDGLTGFVGVDFVVDPSTDQPTLIEINPRLTTSVVGWLGLLPPGLLARTWLSVHEGGSPPGDWTLALKRLDHEAIEFLPDGRTRRLR